MTSFERATLVALTACATFAATLLNGYAFDDLVVIQNNAEIRSLGRAILYFVQPVFPGDLYRPITMFSYALQYQLTGLHPLPFHLINLLLHACASVLSYFVLKRVIGAERATIAALLFAALPIHVEAVANVVGRAELLAAVGVLGAMLTNSKIRCFLLALLGMLCKESALVLLALLPLYLFFSGISKKDSLVKTLPALFAALVYLSLRHHALHGIFGNNELTAFIDNPLIALSPIDRAIAAASILGQYVVRCVFPYSLSADYSYAHYLPGTLGFIDIFSLIATFSLLFVGLVSLSQKSEKSFAILWFFCAFALTANVFFPIGTIMAERLAYLPSLGICVLASLFLNWRIGKVIVLVFAVVSAVHSKIWKNNEKLFTYQLEVSGRSAKTQLNAALFKKEAGDLQGAELHLREALEIYPAYAHAAFMLGEISTAKQISADAENWYGYAIEIDPKHKESFAGLGRLRMLQGKFSEAENNFEKSLALDPGYYDAQLGLFAVYVNQQSFGKAQQIRDHLFRWDPEQADFKRVDQVFSSMKAKLEN